MGKYKQFVFRDAAHDLLSNLVWWLAHPNECELLLRSCRRRFGRRPVTLWTIAGTFSHPGLHVAEANYAHTDWASCKFSGECFGNCHIGEFRSVVRTLPGGQTNPTTDDVVTIWPPSPCSFKRGRNA